MANYYGQARTNYFAVKDADAFLADMADLPVEVITETTNSGETLYGFLDANQDGAGLDYSRIIEIENEDGEVEETDVDIFWTDILASHLADGHVAILMEIGSEKYRYLSGYAVAVNSKGETREVVLGKDIYDLAHELGDQITGVSY